MTELISVLILWFGISLAVVGGWLLFVEGVHKIRRLSRVGGAGDPFPAPSTPTSRRSATRPLPTRAVKGNLRYASTLVPSPPTDSGTSASEGSPRADISRWDRW